MSGALRQSIGLWLTLLALCAVGARAAETAGDAGGTPEDVASPLVIETAPSELRIGQALELRLRASAADFDMRRIIDVTFEKLDAEQWHTAREWSRTEERGGAPGWLAALIPFATGELPLAATVLLRGEEPGGEVTQTRLEHRVQVGSVLSAEGIIELDISKTRPPHVYQDGAGWLWLAAAAVAAALLAGVVAWRRRTSLGLIAAAEPQLPPGLWALHEIERRSRLPICSSGPAKPIFTMASDIIREYLDRRYEISAGEMTTTECLRALQRREPGDEVIRWVQVFLNECDRVKFTTLEPARERWATIWHDARLIVQQTTSVEELGEGAAPVAAREGGR